VCRVDVQTVRLLVLDGRGVQKEWLRTLQQEVHLLAGTILYCAASQAPEKMAKRWLYTSNNTKNKEVAL